MECFLKVMEQYQIVHIKIDAEYDHEYGHHPLNIGGIAHHTITFDPKATGAGRAESCGNGIKQRHSSHNKE